MDLSEDIRIGRRRRSKAVGWEDRIEAPHRLLSNEGILGHSHHDSGWDPNDERYIEREIVYRGSNHINPTDETIRKPRQNEPTEISSPDAREEVQKLVAIPPEPREALESLSSQKQLLEQDMKAGIDRHEDVERSDASMRAQSGRVPGTEDDRDDNKSRTSSPQGLPMLDTLEEHGDDRGLTVPRATSRPVPATMHTGNSQPGRGDSPRSRRRKILSVELTHPLRENLLRERGTTDRAEVDTEAARDKPRPEQRRRMGAIPREEAQQVGSDASEPETTEEKEEIIIRRVDSEYRPIPHLRDTSREREEVLIRKLDDGSDWAPSPRDERAREEIIIRRGERPDDEYPSGRTNMRKDGYEHDKESTVEQRRESLENYYEAHKMPEQTEKGRIIWEAGGAEEKRKKENEDPKQKRLEVEQEEKERKRKKQTELEDRLFEEKVREKFKLRGKC